MVSELSWLIRSHLINKFQQTLKAFTGIVNTFNVSFIFIKILIYQNGALPQTPVHSFARTKERNQENAPRTDFLTVLQSTSLPAGRQVLHHLKSLKGDILLSPCKGESRKVVLLFLSLSFIPPFDCFRDMQVWTR